MNIVSLLPGATEIVCALGRGGQLRGVSHSCELPAGIGPLPMLTSTNVPTEQDQGSIDEHVRQALRNGRSLYELDIDGLDRLQADVVITQTLCDICAVSTGDVYSAFEQMKSQPALIELAPSCMEDVYTDIFTIARAIDAESEAERLVDSLRGRSAGIAASPPLDGEKVLFLEWLDPPFAGGHWIPDLIEILGGVSCHARSGQPSLTLTMEEINATAPDRIIIACCGLSDSASAVAWAQLESTPDWSRLTAVREGMVWICNGRRHFSRAAPSLVDGLEMLAARLG